MQVRVNTLLAALSAPVFTEPDTALAPVHAPLAVHAVALVEAQVNVELPPTATVDGAALIVTIGAGTTGVVSTVTDWLAEPPAPLQLSVNVLLAAVNEPVLAEPEVARAPLHAPDAEHAVALADDHVSVALEPLTTVVASAVNTTVGVGGGCVTVAVTDRIAVPPLPVQFNVNVLLAAVSAPVLAVPAVPRAPVHPPLATQSFALVDVHVSVAPAPL
jgi:hypothetical protein